jgi:3-mercaptopyruvate sulfurtransferase SseA
VLVMQLVGYNQTKNYDASMGEWANRDDTPLEL